MASAPLVQSCQVDGGCPQAQSELREMQQWGGGADVTNAV